MDSNEPCCYQGVCGGGKEEKMWRILSGQGQKESKSFHIAYLPSLNGQNAPHAFEDEV